jgi:hypothetical protein
VRQLVHAWRCQTSLSRYCWVNTLGKHFRITDTQLDSWAEAMETGAMTLLEPPQEMQGDMDVAEECQPKGQR